MAAACPRIARGYELNTSSKGATVRWGVAEVTVDLALEATPEELTREQASAAVRAALAVWAPHLPADLSIGFVDSDDEGLEADASDRLNVVTWADEADDSGYEPAALAITYVTYRTNSGSIVDADIVINAVNESWVVGSEEKADCGTSYDLQNVITHEFGHFLGLGHSPDDQATMFATAAHCEIAKRDLAEDDVAGVQSLYDGFVPGADSGCGASVGGGRSGWGAALLVLCAALVATRRRTRRAHRSRAAGLLIVAVGLLAAPGSASATLVRELSVQQMTEASDVVARGTVVSQRAVWSGKHIVTLSKVAVSECWAGSCEETVTVAQLGGEIDGVGMLVSGVARLAVGDELVVFLRKRGSGRMAPVGMAQGAFRVIDGTDTALRDLHGLGVVARTGRIREGAVERWSLRTLRTKVRSVAHSFSRQ